ncbi:hypothetical protein SAMN05216588_107267 [Pseudomonas flavescens]|uniref:Uncharacterized protein n=1 Tax=Phytopseudomonas flavescens TaxID=29435 RepID=A0A1G8FGC3_9GAMM|nr:hypothetical protein [Pseudomonas flavescens]SDH81170.1 hypothetical protein SAMN05216588_107267 [Pseudomonas flavescens]
MSAALELNWRLLSAAVLKTLGLLVLRAVLIVAGLVVVPLALPWRRTNESTRQPFTTATGDWLLVTLPGWAWLWSNDRDGAIGDKRGWWHANAPFGLGAYNWFSMFAWLVYRNPANNARFTHLMGCPVTECDYQFWGDEVVKDKPDQGGLRFLTATHRESGRRYCGLYYVKTWSDRRAMVVQLGFKGEPSDWAEDYSGDLSRQWKGFTFEVNPWKNIA